ncbi:MAG: helix-turn-helix transcriptional regulator [Clostridia bacterium]|nr:helix-turn-helix transcriptional regulator [Clostridia bacterium]MBQ7051980.1 helix-turn-helix transcriptional regulator [Clostridia bacterium]
MQISFKIIGSNIRCARKKLHMTQEQAAEGLGISLLHYGRFERGERNISLPLLLRTAEMFHVSINSLLSGCIDNVSDIHITDRISDCSEDTHALIDDLIDVVLKHRQA